MMTRAALSSAFLLGVILGLACAQAPKEASQAEEQTTAPAAPQRLESQVDLAACHFELANPFTEADFLLVISFVLDGDHVPGDLRIFSNRAGLSEETFCRCIGGWRLPQVPTGTEIYTSFRFESGAGWQWVRLSAETAGFFAEIPMQGFADKPRR